MQRMGRRLDTCNQLFLIMGNILTPNKIFVSYIYCINKFYNNSQFLCNDNINWEH